MFNSPKAPPDKKSKEITLDIPHCVRCGDTHQGIKFTLLVNAPDNVTHWALCPTRKQPILMKQSWE